MARDERIAVNVAGRVIEVSNLDKIIYPGDGLVKAEVIRYYVSVAPVMLRHVRGRPLSLVRFPDGVGGEQFFHKNRPNGAPDWVVSHMIGEDKPIDYIVPNDEATLAWLANIAALEVHTMNVRAPHFDRPDFIAFDLDPSPEKTFEQILELAQALRAHLEKIGYRPLVKTSGQKGLHIVCPLHQKWDVDTCLEAARDAASTFASGRSDVTLQMSKKRRQDKTLIDVYRNARGQTMVAAYSLRGREGASVSMPLDWDDLEELESPADFTLRDVPAALEEFGDAWEGFDDHRTGLHTRADVALSVPGNELLSQYDARRDFGRTSEPPGAREAAREMRMSSSGTTPGACTTICASRRTVCFAPGQFQRACRPGPAFAGSPSRQKTIRWSICRSKARSRKANTVADKCGYSSRGAIRSRNDQRAASMSHSRTMPASQNTAWFTRARGTGS
jgi:bifunctional non-homologous end joining protein LigD